MIGKLKGIIDSYGEDFVIVDVKASAIVVHCSSRTLQALPATGRGGRRSRSRRMCARTRSACSASPSDVEREWFRLLQTVQGVGRASRSRCSARSKPADLANAIAMRDKAAVARTPGVGPKVAERIVTELKDKAPAYADLDPAVVRLSGALEDKRAPQPLPRRGFGAGQSRLWTAAGGRRDRRRVTRSRRGGGYRQA